MVTSANVARLQQEYAAPWQENAGLSRAYRVMIGVVHRQSLGIAQAFPALPYPKHQEAQIRDPSFASRLFHVRPQSIAIGSAGSRSYQGSLFWVTRARRCGAQASHDEVVKVSFVCLREIIAHASVQSQRTKERKANYVRQYCIDYLFSKARLPNPSSQAIAASSSQQCRCHYFSASLARAGSPSPRSPLHSRRFGPSQRYPRPISSSTMS